MSDIDFSAPAIVESPIPRTIGRSKRKKRRKMLKSNIRLGHEVRCYICKECIDADDLTLDHVVPLCRGGTNDDDNLKPCCNKCNASKSVDESLYSLYRDFVLMYDTAILSPEGREWLKKLKDKIFKDRSRDSDWYPVLADILPLFTH